ncbi:putative transcriptional regulator, GntR family protein [Streptomyces himastatinicus ATCC 53653]|uniref:Putative transcriptional regulator, GntR family protein n=2 Tax=Streptomyces violaceusniger group TaxID=2839105 RepID=D9WS84_9ACTN|nr:putative transcriptional regulator, GntR family protein [Streptomyces himastatinicus ATCC 53653]
MDIRAGRGMARTTGGGRSSSLASEVARRLRAAIVDGEFDLGEALSEDGLASALGVSRTPVREALRMLQLQGLVEIVPKSGTYVFQPTEDEIFELCEYRTTLEIRAAQLALERNPEAALAAMRRAVEAMTDALAGNNTKAYGIADTAFHEAFFAHCGNRYLSDAYQMSLARVSALRVHLTFLATTEPARSFEEHRRIIEIFAEGRLAELEEILKAHIMRTRENYVLALRDRAARDTESKAAGLRRKLGLSS